MSSDGNLVFCNDDPSAMEPTEPDLWIVPSNLLSGVEVSWWLLKALLIGSKQGSARVSYCRYFKLNALGGRFAGAGASLPYNCRLLTFGVIGLRVCTKRAPPELK